jgi:hypothetical protein
MTTTLNTYTSEYDTFDFDQMKTYFSIKNKDHIDVSIKVSGASEIMYDFCHIEQGNHIILNYIYFKYIMKHNMTTYDNIISYLVNIMHTVLKEYSQFIIHMNIRYLILVDVDKYYLFIKQISQVMKETFPEKLQICYIYNPPFVFSKLFSIISIFIDKNTQQKIKLMDTN